MDPEFFAAIQGAIEKYLVDCDTSATLIIENPSAFLNLDDQDDDDDIDAILNVTPQGVAKISVNGMLTQNGPPPIARLFGVQGTSYKSIIGALDKANADPAVKQATLEINSPGGNIDGMHAAFNAIRAFGKPIAAINTGTMASAAYALGSAVGPGKLYASSPFNITGSIGIIASYSKFTDEAKGVVRREFVSKNAPLKNAAPDTDTGAKAIQAEIDAHERNFMAVIAEGRGISAETVAANYGRGGVFVASDPDSSMPSALRAGMIDKILPDGVPVLTGNAALPARWGTHKVNKPVGASEDRTTAPKGGMEDSMNLIEFLASNPDAKAAYESALALARDEGRKAAQKDAEAVGKILASDAYKSNTVIAAKGLEVLAGRMAIETFDTIVGAVDAVTAATKIAAEAAGPSLKETPAQVETAKNASAELLARAKELKINVDAVQAAAKVHKMDFEKVLQAEVDNAEILASDKKMMGVA